MDIDLSAIINLAAGLCVSVIAYFLKRTMAKLDDTCKEVHQIQLTYVTKSEMKELQTDLKTDTTRLEEDVREIKEKCLTKDDFYRCQMATDKKIDQIYQRLMKGAPYEQ